MGPGWEEAEPATSATPQSTSPHRHFRATARQLVPRAWARGATRNGGMAIGCRTVPHNSWAFR